MNFLYNMDSNIDSLCLTNSDCGAVVYKLLNEDDTSI